ncbi:MAG: heme o synthase [Bacillota bacterium]|uniref:Protoheme IX farnesyltransferase n=1 Tax=Virgibacillus salarius TaxID=447199 RepID=A0A941IAK5_9BACI|nr:MULTISPECIES: heme o synthase [Bacillaceae]NAZ10743.1 protoheme IX farnesyltransferase [Agaribacter marinus]MBR7798034.1 heme o synthase [Virgibacillus salarius]MCC2249637.1 heme o synthase [Virgibacillus sp. AGTR]MDY7044217.1 heme o synthase [Virgibacillus sp. M23]QRZ16841.1 protoheme IX farnesyltransferase [Virgibacillus sp. AGTR]
MDKAETPTSTVVSNAGVSDDKRSNTLLADIKSLIKVGIINSNLITVFAGFWLALYFTGSSFTDYIGTFILTMVGSALVIAGGCMLNNWYDADIDPIMTRTKLRPTVTGTISLQAVLTLGIVTTLIGFGLLLFTTIEAVLFAFIGWFVYVVLYTMWSKRKYTLNTAIGSFSGAAPPLIGWAAVEPNFHIVPFILFLIMFIWQTPHFLALAMRKSKEYKAAGIPMLPVVHGFEFTKRQIVIYIACLLPLPFYLASLGTTFMVIATLLNVGWLAIGISGFFMKNDLKWANIIFIYSLNYLTILFLMMVLVTWNSPFS